MSILTIISKILEMIRLFTIKLNHTWNQNIYFIHFNLVSGAFFNWHLSDLPDRSDSLSNGGFFTGMVRSDLQNAFDTLVHDTLLHKLMALGFDPLAIKWLESYLKGRNKKLKLLVFLSGSLRSTAGIQSEDIAFFIIMTWRLESHVNSLFMLMTQSF